MHIASSRIEEVPYCFSRSCVKLQGHMAKKNLRFWPKLAVSGLYLQFEFTNGYEMMHKAWSSIEEVSLCFSRSYVELQGHTARKVVDFDPNWAFPDCNIFGYEMKNKGWCCKEDVPYYFSGSSIKFQGHGRKINDFNPIWVRLLSKSQLSNPSDLPYYCFDEL